MWVREARHIGPPSRPGEDRIFGTCDFEFESDEAEPKEDIRGDIARIYFYMKQTYGLTAGVFGWLWPE